MNPALEGMSQKERLHEFFSQYVNATSNKCYDADGLFSRLTMVSAVKKLLESGVFETEMDMKLEALKDFDVVIPDELFGEVYHAQE